jgi:hypothetical protein
VWLCNTALGGDQTKEELDNIPSPINPGWTVYKQFKTTKLALNFGMGVAKYCRTAKLPERAGQHSFRQLLFACPAIKQLQQRVAQDLTQKGYVQDVFGHIYSGDVKIAYKVVAYLIQGCGTGSLPKVQMRSVYNTIHQWDAPRFKRLKYAEPYVIDEQRNIVSWGVLSGTTHDEIQGRLSLGMDEKQIISTLQQMMFDMTERFSDRFDGIPLRAKLYLSRGRATEREEVKVTDEEKIRSFLHG